MKVFLGIFVSVYLWSVSILLPVSLFCLLYSKTLPKQNILNITMTVFIKILGVQEAGSLGVVWLKIVSEYDQEIPQSKTADNTIALRGRAAQPSRDTRKTN